jgi:hypothetical protein
MYQGVHARPTASVLRGTTPSVSTQSFVRMGASRSKIGCSTIDTKGLVIRSRCLPDFYQTEIKVVLDLQSTNTNLSNPRCYFACGWTPSRVYILYAYLTL